MGLENVTKICPIRESSLFAIVVVSLLAHMQHCKSLFLSFFCFDEGHSQVPLWDTVGHDWSSRNAVTWNWWDGSQCSGESAETLLVLFVPVSPTDRVNLLSLLTLLSG